MLKRIIIYFVENTNVANCDFRVDTDIQKASKNIMTSRLEFKYVLIFKQTTSVVGGCDKLKNKKNMIT